MGNLKKWLLVLGTMLIISQVMAVRGLADTMTDLTGSPMYVSTSGNSLGPSAGDRGLTAYPTLVSLTANNVVNGRVTTKTTQITVKYSGSTNFKTTSDRFKSFYVDVFKQNPANPKGASGISLATTTTNLTDYGNNANTLSFGSGVTQTVNVDLSDLADELPVYIGFRLVSATNYLSTYYMASLNEDTSADAALKPTITGSLKTSDTTITGTGTNVGDPIYTTINGTKVTGTVGSDKTYSLDLGTSLAGLSSVTVYESNSNGDKGSVTADVTSKSLNIASKTTTADTYPDDLSGLSNDSDVIAWLVKTTGISSSYSDSSSTDGVTYASDTTGLAASLKALADGATMTIPVYAKDGSGLKSEPMTITVTNHAGVLQFGTISSDIGFGSLEIPTAETVFQPMAAWNVNVSDTRAAGSNWSVYATATPLKSVTHTLAGNLIYKDGSTQTVLTNSSTLIDSGTKVAGTTNTQITSDWSATKGIMLDVQPSVYADSYSGSVDWSLQNTPTN